MSVIQAMCPECRTDVRLEPLDITLVTAPDQSSYGFVCPSCGLYVVKPADVRAVKLLLAGGVVPASQLGFCEEDVLELLDLLDREDWFECLMAAGE